MNQTDLVPTFTMTPELIQLREKLIAKGIKTIFEDSFSDEVWGTTYRDHNDDTVDHTMFRVAAAVASMEKTDTLRMEWTEKFYEECRDK